MSLLLGMQGCPENLKKKCPDEAYLEAAGMNVKHSNWLIIVISNHSMEYFLESNRFQKELAGINKEALIRGVFRQYIEAEKPQRVLDRRYHLFSTEFDGSSF